MIIESNRLVLRPWQDTDAPLLYRYASDPDVGPRAGWAPHQSVEESLHIIQTVFRNPTTWAIILKGNTTIPTNTFLPIEGIKEVRSPGRTNGCPGAQASTPAFKEVHSEMLSQSIGSRTNEDSDLLVGAIGYGPSCECNLPAREGEPTVGYWIAKPFWNQGLCTEALQLLIAHLRQQNESNENTGEVPTASRTVICEKNENNRGRDARVPSTREAFSSLISGHFTDNPASGRVMEKCGFRPTGDICYDPTLYNGKARPIRVLRLSLIPENESRNKPHRE